ncbi:MAG: mCpol domain-containing protein [Rhizonema sp. NSF051]|nr:mCpol domain-containing protein [Rhizonema sp. NSF051]
MSKKLLVCIGDGDNIGDTIELHLLSENLEEAGKFSFQVKTAMTKIAELAQHEMEASLVYVAGDDICFVVPANKNFTSCLVFYSDLFLEITGRTMSFGVGRNSIEALISLRKAKVSGKGRVIVFGGIY